MNTYDHATAAASWSDFNDADAQQGGFDLIPKGTEAVYLLGQQAFARPLHGFAVDAFAEQFRLHRGRQAVGRRQGRGREGHDDEGHGQDDFEGRGGG